jgi:hypothetical protein
MMGEKEKLDEHYLSKIRRQGSGLHIYFPSELVRHPDFPLKERDAIIVKIDLKGKSLIVKKVSLENLVGEFTEKEE